MTNETLSTQQLFIHNLHQKLGAKFSSFGAWEVPIYYSNILQEHEVVRQKVGIFDISHMGEVFFEGPGALATLNYLLTNKIDKLVPGKAIYSPMCNQNGGIVDDVIVYQLDKNHYLVIVNAGNVDKDVSWMKTHCLPECRITNRSNEFGILSVQGPKSRELIRSIFSSAIDQLVYYSIMPVSAPWKDAYIARTGYTGELGYEILLQIKDIEAAFLLMLERGKAFGIQPVGFGARDTLRLEAKMPLYGQDMDDHTTPLEAGLSWAVDFEKKSFIGRDMALKQKSSGVSKKLIGFEMIERGLARHGHPVFCGKEQTGAVTSGSFSPTLKRNIGLAYVASRDAVVGQLIEIGIRENRIKAKVVQTPFYKNPSIKE